MFAPFRALGLITNHIPFVLQTRSSSSLSLLPALTERTRTVRATDRETVLLCGVPLPTLSEAVNETADDDADRALLSARRGRVVLGLSGADALTAPQPKKKGMFCLLGEYAGVQARQLGQTAGAQARQMGQIAGEAARKELEGSRKELEKFVGEQMERGRGQLVLGRAQWDRGVGQMRGGTQAMRALTLGRGGAGPGGRECSRGRDASGSVSGARATSS